MKVNILSKFFCYHCLLSLSFADPQSHCCCYLQFKQLRDFILHGSLHSGGWVHHYSFIRN